MKLLTKCTTLMLAAFLAGCSEETQHAGGNQPEPMMPDTVKCCSH